MTGSDDTATRSVALPVGFRNSEVGPIPSEWNVASLSQLAQLERGKFSARPRNDPKYFGGGIPFIQTGDVRNGRGTITAYSQNLNENGLKVSRLFPEDTLFFTIAANIGDLGFAAFATACPDSLVAVRPRSGIHKRWLYFSLSARKGSFEAIATQNAQLNLSLGKLRPYLLAVPPPPEQEAIADALSDVDDLIHALDRLVAKKHSLLRAAMQQLLSGQTRLPGFSDEWINTVLSDIAEPLKGAGLSRGALSDRGGRPCILYGELFTRYGCVIDDVVGRTDSLDGRPSISGDVLMPGSTTTTGIDLAVASVLRVEGVALGGDINVFRRRQAGKYDSTFLARYLTHIKRTEIAERTQGSTIIHLYGKSLMGMSLQLPQLDEQLSISAALSDLEEEVFALEARRDKAQAIRAGMTQELLAGRTRLATTGHAS